MPRYIPKKLSEILSDAVEREELARLFAETEAAAEYEPLPQGDYEVDFIHGEFRVSGKGTPGYTMVFEVTEGEYRGRKIWHTAWLSEAARKYTKRDLAKLGITELEQCEQPVPPGLYCQVRVVVRVDDQGVQRNKVTQIFPGGVRKDATVDSDFGVPPASENNGGAL